MLGDGEDSHQHSGSHERAASRPRKWPRQPSERPPSSRGWAPFVIAHNGNLFCGCQIDLMYIYQVNLSRPPSKQACDQKSCDHKTCDHKACHLPMNSSLQCDHRLQLMRAVISSKVMSSHVIVNYIQGPLTWKRAVMHASCHGSEMRSAEAVAPSVQVCEANPPMETPRNSPWWATQPRTSSWQGRWPINA